MLLGSGALERWSCHEAGAPGNGISALKKKPREPPGPSHQEGGRQWEVQPPTMQQPEPDTESASVLTLDFQPPELYKHLSLLQQPGWMKTRIDHEIDKIKELLIFLGVIL